ncbi:hypothetical protein EZJ49_05250 [Bdellovibrio bacteriovorus]|uniref:hypothetical protein n=1 Tax=Bdellovibrio bacteriovorus TaxID=959 RepID=UPI0021CEED97|nr:hypothetical protein [Bdellovibrio bacteriovorus]UXR65654.1 hypothetical protein EZJ49_05250 [Bdellovibrio bacteriovorus]
MSKRTQFDTLTISTAVYKKALRYALSLNEVGFLFFGKGSKITKVVRIKNINPNKKNRFSWDKKSYAHEISMHGKSFDLVIEGHSHSKINHLRTPPYDDMKYFRKGPHLIVFPFEKNILCWEFPSLRKIAVKSSSTSLSKD